MLTRGSDPDANPGPITEGEQTSTGDPPQQVLGPVDAERSRWLEGSKKACEGDPWNSFDGKCKVKMVHKHLAARTPGNGARGLRVALGRSSSTPPATAIIEADSGTAKPPTKGSANSSKADHPRPTSMNGRKSLHTGNGTREFARPRRTWPDDPWSARAYAWPGAFESSAHARPRWDW